MYRRAIDCSSTHAYALYNLGILLEEKSVAQGTGQGCRRQALSEAKRFLTAAVKAAPGVS